MTTHVVDFRAVSTIGAHVKGLGYGAFKRVRLYGEELKVLSDASFEGDGAAVGVTKRQRRKHSLPAASRDAASERKRANASLALLRIEVP